MCSQLFVSCFESETKYQLTAQGSNSGDGRDIGAQRPLPNDSERDQPPSGPREDDGRNTGSDPERENPDNPDCGEPEYNLDELLARIELLENKKEDWDEIVAEGLESFRIIEPILKKKCYACHDSDRGVPWYGKPFKEHNSVYHHYIDGIAALDFSTKFPLRSAGSNNQIALLNAVKNTVLDETMPLKVYTRFYPRRKIKPQDKMAIKYWVEPLVDKIEAWEQKYIYDLEDAPLFTIKSCGEEQRDPQEIDLQAARKKVTRVFSAKCFRCHANGVSKGGFGNMHDLSALIKTNYIDLDSPDFSELYMISESGEMPPSSRDRLNYEEVQTILEWIRAEADTLK